jgi:hypothetical protein
MKKFLKIIVSLLLIIVAILFLSLDSVEYKPYFDEDYYSNTRARLDSLTNNLALQTGRVQIGFGKVSITPTLGAEKDDPEKGAFKSLPLAGYGAREGKPAVGIHDSLFIKTVALQVGNEVVVLIGSDILIVSPQISKGVSKELFEIRNLQRGQLFFNATHTHSGVGAWSEGIVGEMFAGPANPAVADWLIDCYVRAVEDALDDLEPGSLATGVFEAPGFISNRLIGEKGKKNSEFVFMVTEQESGKKAILGIFGGHPTMLGSGNFMLSGDFPGYWQRKLESSGVDMAVYFAGSVGSHSARSHGDGFEKPKYIGEALADTVLKYTDDILLQDTISLASISLKMDLPEFHFRVSDGIRLTPWIVRKLLPDIGDVYVQTARIGDLMWATAPSDFSGELTIRYRNAMCNYGFNALVTSFNGAYIGYIIPGKYYHLNEYESRLMSWFGPYMEPYTNEMIGRMMKNLAEL